MFLFFKQKTAYEMRISDWSSDVCSSDLEHGQAVFEVSSCDLDHDGFPAVEVVIDVAHAHAGLGRDVGHGGGMESFTFEARTRGPDHLLAAECSPLSSISVRDHVCPLAHSDAHRSEEHTSELQSLIRTSYAAFCL